MKSLLIISSLVLVVLGVGCSNENRWEEAKRINTQYRYEAFLKEYPNDKHSMEAKNRIEELCFEEAKREEWTDQSSYRFKGLSVLKDIQNRYELFLSKYLQGPYSQQAKKRLEELKLEEQEYRAALDASVLGNNDKFVEFIKTHEHYGLNDILSLLQEKGDEHCVTSLGRLLEMYDVRARKKNYPVSTPGMIFIGPCSEGTDRMSIISALRYTGNKNAIPYIIKSLNDPEMAIQTYGVSLQRGFTGPATYYYPVREAAAEALKQMTGRDLGLDQEEWERWWKENGDSLIRSQL